MLSRKSVGSLMSHRNLPEQLKKEIVDFELQLVNGRLAALHLQPLLLSQIKQEQQNDENFSEIIYEVQKEKREDFTLADDGTLMVGKRICVLDKENLKFQLLEEAHQTPYSVHPGATKIYQDLKATLLVAQNEA